LEILDRRIATPAPAWPVVKFNVPTTRAIANTMEERSHSVKHFPRETPATRVLVRLQDRLIVLIIHVDAHIMEEQLTLEQHSTKMSAIPAHACQMVSYNVRTNRCRAIANMVR